MTMVRPCRLMIRHRSHMGLTEGRTFTKAPDSLAWGFCGLLLQSERDATAREVVRGDLDLDLVARQDADVVLPHLTRDAGEDAVPAFELNPEHRARQRLHDLPLQLDLLFLYRQTTPCAPDTATA